MTYGPGDVFAGYTIVRLLGKGGMGSVYLAKHPRLPRHDALKLLSDSYGADATYRSRFEREADLAAQLSHRNIVAVYDRGSQDGRLWIAMQYVAGTDAAQALLHGPMHAGRAAHIVSEIGAGLHYAHLQGMVHRDVKPANILLQESADAADPENVLLADFGIAKLDSSSSTLTGEGNFLGTLPYTAPEVLNGAAPGPSVDLYALGCVLFELLTGRVPFPVTSPLAAMHAHLSTPPPKPSDVAFGVPAGLDAVVLRAMAKDPAERFSSCREMSVAARAAVYVDRDEHRQPEEQDEPGTADRPRTPYTLTVRRFCTDGTVEQLGPVDTAAGSPAERGALETLLRAAGFLQLPLRLPLVRKIDDDPFIEVSVAGGGHERTVGFELAGSRHPIELRLIIERLEQVTAWRRAGGSRPAVARPATDRAQPLPVAEHPPSRPAPALPGPATQHDPAYGPPSQPIPVASGPPSQPTPAASMPRIPVPARGPTRYGGGPVRLPGTAQPRPGGTPGSPAGTWHAVVPGRRHRAQPVAIAGIGIAALIAFSLYFVSPVAGLVAVIAVVVIAAVVLLLLNRER